MDIELFVNITSRAWALPILSKLHKGIAARQAPLLAATGVPPDGAGHCRGCNRQQNSKRSGGGRSRTAAQVMDIAGSDLALCTKPFQPDQTKSAQHHGSGLVPIVEGDGKQAVGLPQR